jgi:anthranilate phosphoribosyltransferase
MQILNACCMGNTSEAVLMHLRIRSATEEHLKSFLKAFLATAPLL